MTTDQLCGSLYPSRSRQPNTRIVHCDLPAGHDGDHMEQDTESTWPRAEPVTPTPAEPRGIVVCDNTPDEPHSRTEHCVNPREPEHLDDLDAFLAEQLQDPAFAEAWMRCGIRDWRAAYERGFAEGLRQATEGWGREWGTVGDGWAYVAHDEKAAREVARYTREPCAAASRLVGPWEPAEQPEPAPCDRTDLPEVADMMCAGCGVRAGDHPAWRRRYGRNRAAEQPEPAGGAS